MTFLTLTLIALLHVTGHMPTMGGTDCRATTPLPDSLVRHVFTTPLAPCKWHMLWSARACRSGDPFAFTVNAEDTCYVVVVVWASAKGHTGPAFADTIVDGCQKSIVRQAR